MTPVAPSSARPFRQLLAGLGLFAVVLLAYGPALGGGFIWDDDGYVTRPALQSLHGLWRIWFDLRATEQYYPLLHSVFWLEHRLWGQAAPAYHWASVLWHALAACLLARVLLRLLGSAYAAWFAALVFALHPVCVESVAWIAEQKNTLSLVFYLASALAYLRFDEGRRRSDYAWAAGFFALAVMSKTVTATLPAGLLVALWWKRGRLRWREDAVPLLPWLVFGAAAGAFSGWVERTYIGARGAVFDLGLGQRLILAGRTSWFYLGKLFWPIHLIFIYPRWTIDARDLAEWLPLIAMAAVALGLAAYVWLRPGRPLGRALLAGLLFFLGSLVPTSGLFNVYGFLFSYVADHWQYLPALGIIVLVAGGAGLALARGPRWARWAAPAGAIALFAPLTWRQAHLYQAVESFYRVTLQENPRAWMADVNLGLIELSDGREAEASGLFAEAIRLYPASPEAHNSYGTTLSDAGRFPEALGEFQTAIRLDPSMADPHANIAVIYAKTGRLAEAESEFRAALRINPLLPEALVGLGNVRYMQADLAGAVSEYRAALRAKPDYPEAHFNLGYALKTLGRTDEAQAEFALAAKLRAKP